MGKYVPVAARRAVERGVTLLDRKFGDGWPALIDLETFDIGDGDRCVLGQVVNLEDVDSETISALEDEGNDYVDGYLAATHDWKGFLNGYVRDMAFEDGWHERQGVPHDAAFGFEANDLWGRQGNDNPKLRFTYEDLQVEWTRVIKRRQKAMKEAL